MLTKKMTLPPSRGENRPMRLLQLRIQNVLQKRRKRQKFVDRRKLSELMKGLIITCPIFLTQIF